MDLDGLLPCSQDSHWSLSWATWLQSHLPLHFPKIHSNNILSCTPRSSKWFRFSNQNFFLFLLCVLHAPPVSFTCFDHPNTIQYSLLQPSAAVFLICPNILLGNLTSNTRRTLYTKTQRKRKLHCPRKQSWQFWWNFNQFRVNHLTWDLQDTCSRNPLQ
jgi:hypothetical protein